MVVAGIVLMTYIPAVGNCDAFSEKVPREGVFYFVVIAFVVYGNTDFLQFVSRGVVENSAARRS